MSLRIPRRIKIGRSKWKIIRDDFKENWSKYDGLCFPDRRQIKLDPRLKDGDDSAEIVFLHELIHAIWPDRICSDTTEERLVEKLAIKLHQVLKLNPGLLDYTHSRHAIRANSKHNKITRSNYISKRLGTKQTRQRGKRTRRDK